MKWLIKNPAPLDSRLKKWGDYHFGRSLTKYLIRRGQEVDVDYDPEWDNNKHADVVLVLRGKHPYEPNRDCINVLWNISHPDTVSVDEFNSYDLVFIASKKYAHHLKTQIIPSITVLLQCTDTEEFFPNITQEDTDRTGYIFVGNSRNTERLGVIWATELGLSIKVWGRMWKNWIDTEKHIVADYIDNQSLGDLYRKSRASLNDHWPDMKKYGYINNRVFDALACGLPIISDYHEALQELFPNEILYYSNKIELQICIEEMLLNYPTIKQRVDGLKCRIRSEFSFDARAKTLIDTVQKFIG